MTTIKDMLERLPRLGAQFEDVIKERGSQVANQVRAQAGSQLKTQLSAEKLIPRVETFTGGLMAGDGLVTTPFVLGFLASGGVGGTLSIPFKLVRVVIPRPIFGRRMEVPRVRSNRNSKELGRALAALAAADRRLTRRPRLLSLLLPSFRKVVLLGGAGAAYIAWQGQNGNGNGDILETIGPQLGKVRARIESTDLYTIVAPDIERAITQLGERVDAIR